MVLGPWEDAQVAGRDTGGRSPASLLSSLRQLREDGLARSEAVKLVAEMTGAVKSEVYALALKEPWPKS